MITVSKKVLAAEAMEYFRRVQEDGEELVVTDNQVPVLKVVPIPTVRSVEDAFGDLRGKIQYFGDVMEPTTDEWPEH